MTMSGTKVREGFETGGAVLGLVDVARAEPVQQRAQDAPHMRVVVDDKKSDFVEIDADHNAVPGSDGTLPKQG